jgi:hypothetical protein
VLTAKFKAAIVEVAQVKKGDVVENITEVVK